MPALCSYHVSECTVQSKNGGYLSTWFQPSVRPMTWLNPFKTKQNKCGCSPKHPSSAAQYIVQYPSRPVSGSDQNTISTPLSYAQSLRRTGASKVKREKQKKIVRENPKEVYMLKPLSFFHLSKPKLFVTHPRFPFFGKYLLNHVACSVTT